MYLQLNKQNIKAFKEGLENKLEIIIISSHIFLVWPYAMLFILHYLTLKIYSRNGRGPKKPDEVLEGMERLFSFEVIKAGYYRTIQGNECHREGKLRSPCLLFLLIKHKCMCKEYEKKSV